MPQERKLGVAVQLDGSDDSDKTFVTITRERGQVQQRTCSDGAVVLSLQLISY